MKKKLKKKKKAVAKKPVKFREHRLLNTKKRNLSREELLLVGKVRGQLEELSKPVEQVHVTEAAWWRTKEIPGPTVAEYQKMDPLAETTMGGSLAGRVVFAIDFPRTFSLLEWVKQDLRKWPWRRIARAGLGSQRPA